MSHHPPVNSKSSPHTSAPDTKQLQRHGTPQQSPSDWETDGASASSGYPSADMQMAHALQFGHSFSKTVQRQAEEDEPESNLLLQRQSTSDSGEDDDETPVQPKLNVGALMRQQEMAQRAQDEEDALRPRVQPKLTIGRPGDKYEQEADRTAAQVMAMPIAPDPYALIPKPGLQRQQEDDEPPVQREPLIRVQALPQPSQMDDDELVRAKPLIQLRAEPLAAPDNFETDLGKHRGGGSPLSDETRSFMEPRFGADFSGVRIHQAPKEAGAIGAQAFTHGQDIYFNSGKYNPGSSSGKELLAHELTHTIQQTGGLQPKSDPDQERSGSAESGLANDLGKVGKGFSNPLFLWRSIQTKLALNRLETQVDDVEPSDIAKSKAIPAEQPEIQAKCSECEKEQNIQRQEISATNEDETLQASFGLDDLTNAASGAADWVGDQAGDAADWVGDRVDDVTEMGADAFAAIVEQVSPNLAALIRNRPEALLSETLEGGIQDWLGGILGDIDIGSAITELQGSLGTVFATLQGVINGDTASCEAFAQGINSLRELAQSFMDNPAVQAIQDAFSAVGNAFQTVTDFIIAPVFDTLMEVAGGVFNQVQALASTIWEWGGAVRDYLSDAWDWVLEQLGIGGDGEGGILDWIKEQASAIWDQIKETFAPVIGPIQTVVTVMVAFSPVGPIIAAVTYGPQIVEAVQWLWNNKNNPDIVKDAHEQMGNTILPQLLSAAQGFSETLQSTATTLISQVVQMSESVLQLLGSISGVPLLSIAQDMVQTVSTGVQDFATWCQESFQGAVSAVQSLFTTIQEMVAPYAEVLSSLALAIVNPGMIPVILAGWAWRAIPKCYKIPIINFLLDAVIGILQALPDLPLMGPLWPMLKSGVLGFLEGVKGRTDEEKVAITNKLAKIISGASPDFIFGFVKGLLKGIWEGLTDPFVLMYSAIQGLGNLIQWLNNTVNSAFSDNAGSGSETSSPAPEAAAAAGDESSAEFSVESVSSAVASGTIPASERQSIGTRMGEMGAELQPPAEQVTGGFMPAVEEAFSGGEGMSYEQLTQKLGEAWGAVQNAIRGAGQQLANKACEFLLQPTAEGAMGEAVGWLAGTIVFEVVLGILTAGSVTAAKGAMKVLKIFAKVLDWTGEVMGVAFKALAKLGGFVMDAVRGIGKLLSNAGGAARAVMDALREIGEKLLRFADELLGRVSRGAAGEAAETAAERTARETAEAGAERTAREAAQEAVGETVETGAARASDNAAGFADEAVETGTSRGVTSEGTIPDIEAPTLGSRPRTPEVAPPSTRPRPETPAPRNADGTADISNATPNSGAARESSVRDSGRIESDQLSEQQISNELDHIRNNPDLMRGTPPNRQAQIGDHVWHEQAGGHWCRHSDTEVCVANFDTIRSQMRAGDPDSAVRQIDETDRAYEQRLEELRENLRQRENSVTTEDEMNQLLEQQEEVQTRLERLRTRQQASETSLSQPSPDDSWHVDPLPGGRKVQPVVPDQPLNPANMSDEDIAALRTRYEAQIRSGRGSSHIQERLRHIEHEQTHRATQQAIADSDEHYERLVRGMGDNVDAADRTLIVDAITTPPSNRNGSKHLRVESPEQAERIFHTLDEMATEGSVLTRGPENLTPIPPNRPDLPFRGPEHHPYPQRGANRSTHFNAVFFYQGQSINLHIYWPE